MHPTVSGRGAYAVQCDARSVARLLAVILCSEDQESLGLLDRLKDFLRDVRSGGELDDLQGDAVVPQHRLELQRLRQGLSVDEAHGGEDHIARSGGGGGEDAAHGEFQGVPVE